MEVEDRVDYVGSLFRFVAIFQQKEFVGQKAVSQDVEVEIGGDSCKDLLDVIWANVGPWIKREVIVEGDNFRFAEKETPDREEIGKFIIFQDKAGKKNYSVGQLNSDVLQKFRDKHVHVMVHVYGKAVSSKPIHQKMAAAILEPINRDRAGAHSTASLMELADKLQEMNRFHLSGHNASFVMWANAIHAAPANRQEAMTHDLPPSHLVHLFRSVPTSEAERIRSTQNGLQVAGNLNDLYSENVKILRQEFEKLKETIFRSVELYEIRLKGTEDMLAVNKRLVDSMDGQLRVDVTAVSLEEEQRVTDMADCDHN